MWYNEKGKDYDVVISTRVRYARNIKDLKFPNIMMEKELNEVINKVEKSINNKLKKL